MRFQLVCALALAGCGIATAVAAPAAAPRDIAPGVWMIPGGVLPDHQPDGNTVIFEAPDGLVVVDTGRHDWQRDAILAFAQSRDAKIVAIVNTHWHLDHVSGNPALRAAYPGLRVYASDAIDGALAGFLARSARESAAYLDDTTIPEAMRDDIRGDIASIGNGAALRPDAVIGRSGPVKMGGLTLMLHLARDAVTAGDLWVYDARRRVAALGDLVTLPAPFLDTACPQEWQAELARVGKTDFKVAIPGHGPPLERAQFEQYRHAFGEFVACANTARPAVECAGQWADSVQSLLPPGPAERQRAVGFAEYYVGLLRAHDGRSEYCASAPASSR